MYALEAIEIIKVYGQTRVLDKVTIRVNAGEIYGLLGPNGAGKSTLMEIILGLRRQDSGTVKIFGVETRNRDFDKKLVGYVPQDHLLYENLSGIDNIKYFAGLYGVPRKAFKERLDSLKNFLELDDNILKKDVVKLSGGQRRRVALAASLIADPKIIIMDEPTTGLDPNIRRDFWRLITDLNKEGKTILLSTHYMEEADELCDRVSIIDRGRILVTGAPDDLKKQYGGEESIILRLKSRYLDHAQMLFEDMGGSIVANEYIKIPGLNEVDIPRVKKRLDEAGIPVEGIEVRRPTLEDVFINLTGRRLVEE